MTPDKRPRFLPSRAFLWTLVLSLGGMMLLAHALDAYTYRRYYRRYRTRKTKPVPRLAVVIRSLRSSGKIDKGKLRESIESKLKRIAHCYGVQMLGLKRKKDKKTQKRPTRRKKPKARRKKSTKPKKLGRLDMLLRLNGVGRAVALSIQRSTVNKAYNDCFFWYFRGRKFFPPQGNKEIDVRVGFGIEEARPKKKPKVRPLFRSRGGKW